MSNSPSRALLKRPGQNGSTSTPAALIRVVSLSAWTKEINTKSSSQPCDLSFFFEGRKTLILLTHGDINPSVVKNKSAVDTSQFRVRHDYGSSFFEF